MEVTEVDQSGSGNATQVEYSDIEVVLLGAATAILVAAIVFGNMLVIGAILRFRRLQTVTNLLIASLSAADLIVGAAVVPLGYVYILSGSWQFGDFLCEFWTAMDVLCVTASIETLCVIALDRYLAITSPLRYTTLLTRGRALAAIVGVWAVASLISFPPIHLKLWVSMDQEARRCLADERCCDFNTNAAYAVSSSVVSFYIPLVVMAFLYARVYREAQRQLRKIRKDERRLQYLRSKDDGGGDGREDPEVSEAEKDDKHSFKLSVKEHKAVRTLGIIMGTFTLCWLPFFILNILMAFMHLGDIKLLFRMLNWLGYSNSAFNPLIYCHSPDFRNAFQRILCFRKARRRGRSFCTEGVAEVTTTP
ncbi:beta-2 adrenergic receptor-like [Corythoichthys intestinalis]|uniref:beta-2 adrenergic receptor-like n=1 Tax=Corythoichthys intestinalis TaxID=161448 RepID=UPI0025A4E770|nr:beta-2 adrenergic receptor-like [Corythoichthys intestinalis]XP_061801277.1 beta-2 adrenergic receptor-like [Nerophis lumbriciformis]